jgi:hypothetical protein
VVKTDKSIGTRVSDIGPGGKEYNVKTDKEWDKQKDVSEGTDDIRSARVGDEIIFKNPNYRGVIVKLGTDGEFSFKNESDGKRYRGNRVMIARNLSQEQRYKEKSDVENKRFDDALASDMERIHKSGALEKFGIGVAEEVDLGQYDARKSTSDDKDNSEIYKIHKERMKQYGDELEQRQKEKQKSVKEGIPNSNQDPNLARAYHMGVAAYKAYKNDPERAQMVQDKIESEFPQYLKMWTTGYHDGERFDKQSVKEAKRKPSLRNPKDNPCWKGYEPVGTKEKDGRTVPNCVPKK